MRLKAFLILALLSQSTLSLAAHEPKRNDKASDTYVISGWIYWALGAGATAVAGYFTLSRFWPTKPPSLPPRNPYGDPDLSLDALGRDALARMAPPPRGLAPGGGSLSGLEFSLLDALARSEGSARTQQQSDVIDRNGTDTRFLRLHDILMTHSPRYREMVQTIIEQRHGATIRILAQRGDEFEFGACWRADIAAVMITNPQDHTDDEIGGLIVMEMANAYHAAEFDRVHALAIDGHYEQHHPADPATHYAFDNEEIEQRGIQLHRPIIEELIENTRGHMGHGWHRYRSYTGSRAQDFSAYVRSPDSESHIEYWRSHYNKLRPDIKAKRESEVTARIRQQGKSVLPPLKRNDPKS